MTAPRDRSQDDDRGDRPTRPGRRAVRIGLTGPIGCGKSTIAGWLVAAGAIHVDADALARSVTAPGEPATAAILAAFGSAIEARDGALDRAALASIVFSDPDALRRLEAIVHPAVRPRISAAIAAADEAGAPAVIIEAIRLVEGGHASTCDAVWLVTCDAKSQATRLAGRGVSPDDAARRVAAQSGLMATVEAVATRIIDSSGSAETVRAAVLAAYADELVRRRVGDGGAAG